MDWNKLLKALIAAAEDQHWRVEKRQHYIFYPPDKHQPPVVVASTPGGSRSQANTIAALRRAGLIWPPARRRGQKGRQ
jgi:hypothetical protein